VGVVEGVCGFGEGVGLDVGQGFGDSAGFDLFDEAVVEGDYGLFAVLEDVFEFALGDVLASVGVLGGDFILNVYADQCPHVTFREFKLVVVVVQPEQPLEAGDSAGSLSRFLQLRYSCQLGMVKLPISTEPVLPLLLLVLSLLNIRLLILHPIILIISPQCRLKLLREPRILLPTSRRRLHSLPHRLIDLPLHISIEDWEQHLCGVHSRLEGECAPPHLFLFDELEELLEVALAGQFEHFHLAEQVELREEDLVVGDDVDGAAERVFQVVVELGGELFVKADLVFGVAGVFYDLHAGVLHQLDLEVLEFAWWHVIQLAQHHKRHRLDLRKRITKWIQSHSPPQCRLHQLLGNRPVLRADIQRQHSRNTLPGNTLHDLPLRLLLEASMSLAVRLKRILRTKQERRHSDVGWEDLLDDDLGGVHDGGLGAPDVVGQAQAVVLFQGFDEVRGRQNAATYFIG
jgi:hypothetical protein